MPAGNAQVGPAQRATLLAAPLSAQRLLIMGGIALILAGMMFGDIFAVFVLHPNAGAISRKLLAASQAVATHQPGAMAAIFNDIGSLLENRGTKVDAHVHITDFGYLAFILALLQPFIAFSERRKRQWAILFLIGAVLLPVGVFVIHYAGLAYSPFQFIGWASVAADFGGLLVIIAFAGELTGIWGYLRGERSQAPPRLAGDNSLAARMLFSGGLLLILAGFLFGGYYAAFDLYQQEAQEVSILGDVLSTSSSGASATAALNDYDTLQADRAVKIAAHAHFIEFGVIAFLLGFIQPFIFLQEKWKNRWAVVLLAGSWLLPVFVALELRWGLLAGGIADLGGALVMLALAAMLVGLLRQSGRVDSQAELAW